MNTTELQRDHSQDPRVIIEALGLIVTSQFIPFSQSRNKNEKQPSLNWHVTLQKDGRDVLTTDYSAGCAYAPSYRWGDKPEQRYMVAYECERGFRALGVRWGSRPEGYGAENAKNRIEPNALDVIYSLVMDYDVLKHSTFESWAADFGYDVDSRKAEHVYRACLEIALKLRNGIGEAGLSELREAFQDY
jgi:hypothetical protein